MIFTADMLYGMRHNVCNASVLCFPLGEVEEVEGMLRLLERDITSGKE